MRRRLPAAEHFEGVGFGQRVQPAGESGVMLAPEQRPGFLLGIGRRVVQYAQPRALQRVRSNSVFSIPAAQARTPFSRASRRACGSDVSPPKTETAPSGKIEYSES